MESCRNVAAIPVACESHVCMHGEERVLPFAPGMRLAAVPLPLSITEAHDALGTLPCLGQGLNHVSRWSILAGFTAMLHFISHLAICP